MINQQIKKLKEDMSYQDKSINIYGDESCHLIKDNKNIMVLGVVWCEKKDVKQITNKIKMIKQRYGLRASDEIKWTKIANGNLDIYKRVVDYFFDEPLLHFRGYIILEKNKFSFKNYEDFDDFYYKSYFHLLNFVLKNNNKYNIFLDIKDTRSSYKIRRLNINLSNANKDYLYDQVKINVIRSEESQLLQLADILIGSLSYENRNVNKSKSKMELIKFIKKKTMSDLKNSSIMSEEKFNLFVNDSKVVKK